MKLALVDNMNNNFFALVRYFRDLGVDADLFLVHDSNLKHFAPDQDSWKDLSKASWIKTFPVNYHWKSYFSVGSNSLVRKSLLKYDKVIACGQAVGILYRAGIKVDIFIPYGSDLINLPFTKSMFSSKIGLKDLSKYFIYSYLAFLQRKGIVNATTIISNANWKVAQDALDILGREPVNLPRIMVYKEAIPQFVYDKFDWIKAHDFTVFSPTRHLWKTNAEPMADFELRGGAKRNDKLIRAFSRIVNDKLYTSPLLIFCEYGPDVQFSKALIQELAIEKFVQWVPIMPRKELVVLASLSTVVADQFREGMCATSAGTTNEALAFGTPIVTNTDGAIYKADDPYFGSPILEALSEDEIYQKLTLYATNPDEFKTIGENSEKWFDAHLAEGLAKTYLSILQ
jgi:glycosyltransferase involved in cell wall biosynthesis